MNLPELKAAYESRALKAGDIVRQIDFAGIALIWIFRAGVGSATMLDPMLLRAALLIFTSLFFDLAQYLLGTLILFLYYRIKEKQGTSDEERFDFPVWLPLPMWVCFCAKSALTVTAYAVYILPFLAHRFNG